MPYNKIDEKSGIAFLSRVTKSFLMRLIKKIMKETIEIFAADASRTISVVYNGIVRKDRKKKNEEFFEMDLTLLSIFGIRDPLSLVSLQRMDSSDSVWDNDSLLLTSSSLPS